MSSGLGEWEKGIPCMLHGSQGRRPGGAIGLAPEVRDTSRSPLWPPGPVCGEPSSLGCGQRAGSCGPCLQCLFQPWLTRVRARPCHPPLQDVRPRNCLQLQSAGPQPWLPTGTRA